jgi:hypothetical protein
MGSSNNRLASFVVDVDRRNRFDSFYFMRRAV